MSYADTGAEFDFSGPCPLCGAELDHEPATYAQKTAYFVCPECLWPVEVLID